MFLKSQFGNGGVSSTSSSSPFPPQKKREIGRISFGLMKLSGVIEIGIGNVNGVKLKKFGGGELATLELA